MFRPLLVAMLLSPSMLLLSGCITEGGARPPRPKPRTIPEPAGLRPATLLLNATPFPIDTDGNGYADTFTVSIFLFAPANQYPIPIHADGVFDFTLKGPNDELLAEWTYEGERVEQAKVRPLTGPGYNFDLNINEVASDRINIQNGSLRCTWIGPDGLRVPVRGPTIVRTGRTGVGG